MTRAEIKRHAAAILKLRTRKKHKRPGGNGTVSDRRHVHTGASATRGETAAVDEMFEARQRSGRFPKGCWQ